MAASTPAPAADLARLLGPLRRRVLRRSQERAGLPDLTEAQVEVLRALTADGRLGLRELARRLRLARPTVSNLLRTLTAAGLVARTPGTGDQRRVEVSATGTARDLLDRYDAASTATLTDALDRMDAADRAALPGAVAVLERLLATLDDQPPG